MEAGIIISMGSWDLAIEVSKDGTVRRVDDAPGVVDPDMAEALGKLLQPLAGFANLHTGDEGHVFTVTSSPRGV